MMSVLIVIEIRTIVSEIVSSRVNEPEGQYWVVGNSVLVL